LVGFLVGFETMHAARHAHTPKGFAPRDGIGLVAARGRKPVRRFGTAADHAVYLLLDVDNRLFHGFSE